MDIIRQYSRPIKSQKPLKYMLGGCIHYREHLVLGMGTIPATATMDIHGNEVHGTGKYN